MQSSRSCWDAAFIAVTVPKTMHWPIEGSRKADHSSRRTQLHYRHGLQHRPSAHLSAAPLTPTTTTPNNVATSLSTPLSAPYRITYSTDIAQPHQHPFGRSFSSLWGGAFRPCGDLGVALHIFVELVGCLEEGLLLPCLFRCFKPLQIR